MKRHIVSLSLAALVGSLFVAGIDRPVAAHCQVPCGIYDDAARIKSMEEDATTIAKAMDEMAKLMDDHTVQNVNQAVRWVNTKEEHASRIIETVSVYFLTQKVKEVAPSDAGYQDYLKLLADHHLVMRAAMLTKQTTDPANVKKLQAAIHTLAHHYGAHDH